MPTAIAQTENTEYPQDAPEQPQQQKQPLSDRAGSIQTGTMTTAVAQAQFIPGLSRKLPDDRETLKETSQLEKASVLRAAEQWTPDTNTQSPAGVTGKLMEKLSPSTPSKTIGNDITDNLLVINEVPRVVNMPSGTNGRTVMTVHEKTEAGTSNRAQQGDDSTARTDELASHNNTKRMVGLEHRSHLKLSTKDGEITTKPSAPLYKDPVQDPTPQHASRKRTSPTRVPTDTRIVPTKTRAEGCVSKPLEATPLSKYKKYERARGDKISARSTASRSEGRNGDRRVSSPARERRADRNEHMTWETYNSSPLGHLPHPGAGREQRHRSASHVAPWPIDDEDKEVERLASRHPDLRDWLELTGWHFTDYRMGELDRRRRMADIDREKARLKDYGEPVSLKRRRIGESDDKDDRPLKYYRTNQNQRGSRSSGHQGSGGPHHRGREEGGRPPPHRGFSESSPRRYLPQRNPREPYRPPSAAGHPLPHNDFNGERTTDWYMTRDRPRPHRLSPRRDSSPYHSRGYFHEP